MKKLLSVLLALAMMLSLFGVAALADGEAEEVVETEEVAEDAAETPETEEEPAPVLTILLTGEVGLPAAEETEETEEVAETLPALSYAGAAALKEHFAQNGATLLVDAGGFAPSAAEVMEAAGYDLAITAETIESETLVALAPVADSPAGMMMNKGEMIVAFIGFNIPAEKETEEGAEETEEAAEGEEETDPNAALYAVIQESVDKAADADCVILIGLCADAKALAENVAGVDAILTTGEGVETIEKEDETSVLVVGAKAAFGSIGVVTIDGEGITAEVLDGEGYAALELTESEDVAALEAAWIEEANKPVEEQPEEPAQPQEPEQTDTVVPTPAVTPPTVPGDDIPADDSEEAPADDSEEVPADDGEEVPADDSEEAPADDSQEAPADDSEEAPADDGEEVPADDGEEAPTVDSGEVSEEVTPTPEPTVEPTPEPTPEVTPEPDNTIHWTKGGEDLEIPFEARVSELKIGSNKLVEGSDYTVGEGGNVVHISAAMLNGWGNGKYEFVATYPDGSQASQLVSIAGEAPAVTAEPVPTATPEPTAEPTPEPTAAPDETIKWTKGTDGLKITFEARVSQLKVGGNILVEGSDYTVSDGGNEVTVSANMLNGWPNAKYQFTAVHPDGSESSRMVSVSGNYKAPAEENEEKEDESQADATATPAPTKTPESSPNTGDTNPILLYVIILVVLVIALVVVLVMTGKKNKRRR